MEASPLPCPTCPEAKQITAGVAGGAAGAVKVILPKNRQLISGQIILLLPSLASIRTSSEEIVNVNFTPLTDIWKGRHDLGEEVLCVGDFVDAFVTKNTYGDYIVHRMYANILNLSGQIVGANGAILEVLPQSRNSEGANTKPARTVLLNHKGTKTVIWFAEGCKAEVGRHISFVGCLQPDGRVVVTRAWFYHSPS